MATFVRSVPSLLLLVCLVSSASAGSSSSLMDISADGKLLACTNRDSGTVSIVDLATHKKLREVKIGKKPEGVTFLGGSHRLAAAVYDDDLVVFVDADAGRILGKTEVFDEPYGVVSSPDGSSVYVTLDYPGQVVEIDAKSFKQRRSFDAGKFPRGLAITADGKRLYCTEYYTGHVRAFEAATGKQVDFWKGTSNDNLARQIVLHPKRPKAYLPHIRSKITAVHGAGSIFPYVTVIDTNAKEESRRKRIPMDSFLGNLVTANPWECDISPDGRSFVVVFGGTDDMFVCDVLDDDYNELAIRRDRRTFLRTGANPRAVKFSPDGERFYVYNALDFNVVAYNAKTTRRLETVAVTENPLGEEVLLGKRLFYSANQPMAGPRWISCSSCHPDGQPDGRTWHNPEGLRNTQSLAGMAWTHPIHWSADRDEVQDFEHTIRGKLMLGRGLIRGRLNKDLGPPNKGLSKELDALAAYSNSHTFTLSPYARNGLNESAKRGKTIFFSKKANCASCHSGPMFTDSRPGPAEKIVRHDVGTGKDDPGEKMGPAYDTPTLLAVYRTAPYLHHGKAATLADVLTTYNRGDKHGGTSHLSKPQMADLVEFLKALPYEDPQPQAMKAGLTKVER